MRLYHVLDADQASVGSWIVVEDALPNVLVDMRAVVVGFNVLAGIVGVGVESIQVGAELFWWVSVLGHSCRSMEDCFFG